MASSPSGQWPRIRQYAITAALLVVGFIHLLPLWGVMGPAAVQQLYGLAPLEPNLAILLQHRAVLFGLLGVGLVISAFRPKLHVTGTAAGAVSVVSFLIIAALQGPTNAALARVVMADWIALGCLVLAAVLLVTQPMAKRVS